ncbi:hypothetical protein GOBAR_AA36791 [Gossypium barbadense]|nr:hypothetical protein GOBAR_AA36791 [Gossypium barbadense]
MSGLTLKDRTQEEVAVVKAEKVLAEKVVEQKKKRTEKEELSKEEEAAKAKEALERKRRKAEKAKAREAKRDANEAVAKPPQNSQHCQHRKKTSIEETKNATVEKGSINTNTRP